ncbi:MAG TPA: condensation domain-containing protein, partial [Candidatus Deferrimicrobium sp.]|nr:condensation domain-containing protein [Candidatus Deferrimicrobium sp.]
AKLMMHWGVQPHAMIGYSFGEYVAACLAGVFSLEDILKLLAARGKLISQLPAGTMLSVPLPAGDVLSLLPKELSLAIDNGSSCVVSGPGAAVELFAREMKENKVLTTPFASPYAGHSQMLEPILAEFKKEVTKITLNAPQIPYISTVTGTWITIDDAQSPEYWAKQLSSTVYFVQGIRKILEEMRPLFLEIGPGRDMSALVNREIEDKKTQWALNLVKHHGVQKEISDEYYLLDKIGRLWLYGVNIDWQAFHGDYPESNRTRVSLPTYPFEQQRYWKIIDDFKAGKYIFQRGGVNPPESVDDAQAEPFQEKQQSGYKTAWYERPQLSTHYAAPQNEIEEALVNIWQHLFGIEQIGIKDDFFELGGDSLKAMHVLASLHKETNRLVPLHYFFDNPTIAQVASYAAGEEKEFVSIQPLEKKEYYRLSSAQKRMYFFQQVDPGGIAYNNVLANVIEGELDTGKLTNIFKQLIARHDCLRTSFVEVNGQLVQRIHDHVEFEITNFDRGDAPGLIKNFIRPFDLVKAPLMRVGLLKMGEQEHILIVDMHHIISDGTSVAILIEEFMAVDQGLELPAPLIQYKDYAGWQNREMAGGALALQRDYWLSEFAGEIPVLDLPYDYVRPGVRTFSGKVLQFDIAGEETRALNRLAAEQGATLYMALLAITNIFLAKLSGQETVVIGTPTAGRTHADLGRIIGMFVNTLALKNEPAGEKTIREFLNEVKENTISAFANQEYQYEELVEHLLVDRGSGRNPLFDVLFALQNVAIRGIDNSNAATNQGMNLKVRPFPYEQGIAKFDLSIECFERGDILSFNLEYGTELFKDETAAGFVDYFKKILSLVVERPDGKISGLEIISDEEKKRVLSEFNNTDVAYAGDKTIPQLFTGQAAQNPDRIALVGQVNLTYRQLNEQSGQVAGSLIEKGVRADTIVAIKVERSIELVIGLIGILKSGGAYLPIAPDYPPERIDFMLKDSGAKILLTAAECNLHHSSFIIHHSSRSNHLAYIIYTSGSTGKPKGVAVEHRAVVNRLYFVKDHYRLDEYDVILQKTPFTFDVSVCELFRWILPGAKLCLLPLGGENQPDIILDTIEKHKATTVDFVPSALTVFLEFIVAAKITANLRTLRWVFIGAETVRMELVAAFNKVFSSRCNSKAQLINAYGPTEATVDVTYFNCSHRESLAVIPIGKPMANVRLFILDKNYLHVQPVGIAGELCIGGRSLARGYLNNPELTNKSFFGGSRGAVFS